MCDKLVFQQFAILCIHIYSYIRWFFCKLYQHNMVKLLLLIMIGFLCACAEMPAKRAESNNVVMQQELKPYQFKLKSKNILLIAGDTPQSIADYERMVMDKPAGIVGYVGFSTGEIEDSSKSLSAHLPQYLSNYPDAVLAIQVDLSESIALSNVELNRQALDLLRALYRKQQPVLLLLGNYYLHNDKKLIDANAYQRAWEALYRARETVKAENINFVWQHQVNCDVLAGSHRDSAKQRYDLNAWWPSKIKHTDWVGVNFIEPLDRCDLDRDAVVFMHQWMDFLTSKAKPILASMHQSFSKVPSSLSLESMNKRFISLIDHYQDHIRAVAYIDRLNDQHKLQQWFEDINTAERAASSIHEKLFLTHSGVELNRWANWNKSVQSLSMIDQKGQSYRLPGVIRAENFDQSSVSGDVYQQADNTLLSAGFKSNCQVKGSVDAKEFYNHECLLVNLKKGDWFEYSVYNDKPLTAEVRMLLGTKVSEGNVELQLNSKKIATGRVKKLVADFEQSFIAFPKISFPAGTHRLKVIVKDVAGEVTMSMNYIEVEEVPLSRTYLDDPMPIPGVIQSEHYDTGGQGVGFNYHQNKEHIEKALVSKSLCSRDDNVQFIDHVNDACSIRNIHADDWFEYGVLVTESGRYQLEARVATGSADMVLDVLIGGKLVLDDVSIKPTGSMDNYETLVLPAIDLVSGYHRIKIHFDQNHLSQRSGSDEKISSNEAKLLSLIHDGRLNLAHSENRLPEENPHPTVLNWDYMELYQKREVNNDEDKMHVNVIPGVIDIDSFNQDAYRDLSAGNQGNTHTRNTCHESGSLDFVTFEDQCVLVNNQVGEWVEYTVNVLESGRYDLNGVVYAEELGGSFYLQLNGKGITPPIKVTGMGHWAAPSIVSENNIYMPKGVHILRLVMINGGSTGSVGNIAKIEFLPHHASFAETTLSK